MWQAISPEIFPAGKLLLIKMNGGNYMHEFSPAGRECMGMKSAQRTTVDWPVRGKNISAAIFANVTAGQHASKQWMGFKREAKKPGIYPGCQG
jgi:hypothetical protein